MGSTGSRFCLFSIDTSDVAQFPPRPLDADPSLSPESGGLDDFSRRRRRNSEADGLPDASMPWLQPLNRALVDIDAPPRPLDEDDESCLWRQCCNLNVGKTPQTFSTRELALIAARGYSEDRDFERAFSAYRQALDMRSKVTPRLPTSATVGDSKIIFSQHTSPPFVDHSVLSEDAPIYDELGQLCFGHNLQDKALLFYERATWLDKKNTSFWYRRGVVYQNSGSVKLALKCFERCLELDKNFVPAMFHLGVIFQRKGNCHGALAHFNALLELEPTHTEALVLAAECYDRLNMIPEALEYIDRVLLEDPTYFAARRLGEKLRESAARRGAGEWGFAGSREGATFSRHPQPPALSRHAAPGNPLAEGTTDRHFYPLSIEMVHSA